MITDEKAKELVARANLIVAAGFGREGIAFPEHVAIASPLVAAVFVMLVEQEPTND